MLDTDMVSFIVKRRDPALSRMLAIDSDSVCISVVTEAEQRFGMERMTPGSNLYRSTEQFLEAVTILPWDSNVAEHFAPVKKYLSDTRQQIGDLDTMIAAHALSVGATLVTNNFRHFRRIPGPLKLENWLEPSFH